MTGHVLTPRLRLEPISLTNVDDLWRLHRDPGVAFWNGGVWSRDEAERMARKFGASWRADDIGEWLAYDRVTGDLVGRGGASRAVVDGMPADRSQDDLRLVRPTCHCLAVARRRGST